VRFRCANFKAETIEGVCEITGMEKYLVKRRIELSIYVRKFSIREQNRDYKSNVLLVEVAHKSVTHTRTRTQECNKSI